MHFEDEGTNDKYFTYNPYINVVAWLNFKVKSLRLPTGQAN